MGGRLQELVHEEKVSGRLGLYRRPTGGEASKVERNRGGVEPGALKVTWLNVSPWHGGRKSFEESTEPAFQWQGRWKVFHKISHNGVKSCGGPSLSDRAAQLTSGKGGCDTSEGKFRGGGGRGPEKRT